jgi:hypothetical protein
MSQSKSGLPLLTDSQGRQVQILWYDEDWEAHLLCDGHRVGRIRLEWDPPRLNLLDIKIAPTYRGCGLGAAAIREVISLARRKGINEITAYIVRKDLIRSPRLPSSTPARVSGRCPLSPTSSRTICYCNSRPRIRHLAFLYSPAGLTTSMPARYDVSSMGDRSAAMSGVISG